MATDKIGNISSEAMEKPPGEMKMSKESMKSGMPHKHGEKMPHEYFHDKMADKLGC